MDINKAIKKASTVKRNDEEKPQLSHEELEKLMGLKSKTSLKTTTPLQKSKGQSLLKKNIQKTDKNDQDGHIKVPEPTQISPDLNLEGDEIKITQKAENLSKNIKNMDKNEDSLEIVPEPTNHGIEDVVECKITRAPGQSTDRGVHGGTPRGGRMSKFWAATSKYLETPQ